MLAQEEFDSAVARMQRRYWNMAVATELTTDGVEHMIWQIKMFGFA